MRVLIPIALLALAGCAKSMPVVVEPPKPSAPAECDASIHPKKLKPLPRAKSGDRPEDVAAAVSRVQRANRAQYAKVLSDASVCGVFVRGITKGEKKGP